MNSDKKLKDECLFLWHQLPALVVGDKVAIFSNFNGKLKVIELEQSEIDSEEIYNYLNKNNYFDCLDNNVLPKSDTITLVLTLTRGCNSLCRYCFLSATTEGKTMRIETIYASIDKAFELAKGKNLTISFLGGEPTFKFLLLKSAVEYAEKHPLKNTIKDLKFGITTNGVFGPKIADFFLEHRFKISISLDGIPEVQNFHRPMANNRKPSDIIEKNILKLAPKLSIKTLGTVTQFSVNKMVDSVKYFSELGIKRAFFNPVTIRGRALINDDRLNPPTVEDFVNNLKEAILTGEKYGVDVISFPYMNLAYSPMKYCNGQRLVVNYNGDVSSCVEIQENTHPLFEMFRLGHFKENQLILEKTAHSCSQAIEPQKKCKLCPLFFFCGEGCPARNFIGTTNRHEIDDYRCAITKKIMPFILKRTYLATYPNRSERRN